MHTASVEPYGPDDDVSLNDALPPPEHVAPDLAVANIVQADFDALLQAADPQEHIVVWQQHLQAETDVLTIPATQTTQQPLSPSSAAHTRDLVYDGYFEQQTVGRATCGMHALNNAIGFALLEEPDMLHACEVYLRECEFEGSAEHRADHIAPGGWYSEAVLATVLRTKHNMFTLDVNNPVQATEASSARLFSESTAGLVINHPHTHWVAIRFWRGCIWLLNSTGTPQHMSHDDYLAYIAEFPGSFAVLINY